MLTKQDVYNTENINENAVKFYTKLADDRLRDLLETKNQLDQKMFFLLSGYITASITLFGLAAKAVFLNSCFFYAALFLVIGLLPLLVSLLPSKYGALGKNSKVWLKNKDFITKKDVSMPQVYASVLCSYTEKIDISQKSNNRKIIGLQIAILFGVGAIMPFLVNAIIAL